MYSKILSVLGMTIWAEIVFWIAIAFEFAIAVSLVVIAVKLWRD